MDEQLKELISLAAVRGSRYLKGETTAGELPEKIAELGAFLLSRAPHINDLSGDRLREELNDIQQKIDDMRKAIFSNKLKKT